MRIWSAFGLLALLAGCKGDEVEDTDVVDTDDGDTDDGDTDDGDTDPGDTDDTDTPTDTDTGAPFDGLEIEVRFDGPVGSDWRAAAYLMAFDDATELGLVPDREVASAPMTTSPAIVPVPLPELSDMAPLFDDAIGVAYIVYVYEDADGDGQQGAAETIVGAAPQLLLYLGDPGTSGLQAGWEGLALLASQPLPLPYDPTAGFDAADMQPVEQLDFGGTVDASVVGDRLGFASLSYLEEGGLLPDRPVDQRLEDPFTVEIRGPAAASRAEVTDSGIVVGVDYLFAYEDADETGDYSIGDALQGVACWDNQTVLLYWIGAVTRVDHAFALILGDLRPGWQLVAAGEEDDHRLGEVEAQALVVMADTSCGAAP